MFVRTRGYLLYVRGDGRPVFFLSSQSNCQLKLEDGARRIWGEGDRAGELDNRRAREPESQRARGPEGRRAEGRSRMDTRTTNVHGRRHSRRFRSALGAVLTWTAARVRIEEPAPTNSVTRCDGRMDGWTDGRMRMLRTDTSRLARTPLDG